MNSNTIMFTSVAILFLLISSSYGKNVHTHEDDAFEVSQQTATTFLMLENSSLIHNKRESGKNCVLCKFGANPCCAPNQCVKKTLLPDECQEIKKAE